MVNLLGLVQDITDQVRVGDYSKGVMGSSVTSSIFELTVGPLRDSGRWRESVNEKGSHPSFQDNCQYPPSEGGGNTPR